MLRPGQVRRDVSDGDAGDRFVSRAGVWIACQPGHAEDMPLIMMCVKISRHVHQRKRDNMVDVAGYARTDEKLDE